MPDRRPIKEEHEKFWIQKFLVWHGKAFRSRFRVIARPDPPDAIIRSGRVTRWVEIGDVYWSNEWARDQNSYATPGEAHKPIRGGIYAGMDEQFARKFVKVLRNKLAKSSYADCAAQYGPGYLVLPIMSLFFDHHIMRQQWNATTAQNLGHFRSVFLGYRSFDQYRFRRWPLT